MTGAKPTNGNGHAAAASGVYAIEVPKRPSKTTFQLLHGIAFLVAFNICCILINLFQLMFILPLKALRYMDWAERLYDDGIRYTKGAFGTLISEYCCTRFVVMCLAHVRCVCCALDKISPD
jgi:hypothetical protein